MRTPWGPSQQSRVLAPGIVEVETAGHGGIHLSPERQARMPEALRLPGAWYEEDCDWARVAVAFPECFNERDQASALGTLERWAPEAFLLYRDRKPVPPVPTLPF